MLRVRPNFDQVDTDDPNAVHDAIFAALMRVPVFQAGVLRVAIVLPRHRVMMGMYSMHYPADPVSDRSLMQMMFDLYGRRGLAKFTSDGEDDEEDREADGDELLLGLLRSHPGAAMRDGSVVQPDPERMRLLAIIDHAAAVLAKARP